MPDAISAGPLSRESVLEWRTFLLELIHNCFANVLVVVRRRREHAVAMPLTPPSFLVRAVDQTEVRAFEMLARRRTCSTLVTASKNNSKCTPYGAGDEPRGDVLRLFMKASLSCTKCDSGTKARTSSGNSI